MEFVGAAGQAHMIGFERPGLHLKHPRKPAAIGPTDPLGRHKHLRPADQRAVLRYLDALLERNGNGHRGNGRG